MSDDVKTALPPPDTKEIAVITGGRDITRGFVPWNLLEPQDRVLATRGFDYRAYEFVLGDDQVMSTFQQRRLAVTSSEWEVKPGGTAALDKKAADSLAAQLKDAIDWDGATDKMMFGVFYGYAVAECLWATDGAEIVLDAIKVRNRRRFKFGLDQKPKLLTLQSPLGEELPERKFWTFCTGADNDDEPYGLGLAYWLYWPVWFKRNDIRFWLVFLEKFGQPTPVGKYPNQASPEQKAALLRAAMSLSTETAIAIPAGTELALLEAARSGAGDYAAFNQTMNAAISKVTLSQTMTTDDGASLSQAEVHEGVKRTVVTSDAKLINGSFQKGPARWLTEWNYPGAAVPIVRRKIEAEPDLAKTAERDKTIYDMGFDPTQEYIDQTYGAGFVKSDRPRQLLPGDAGLPGSGLDAGAPSFAAPGIGSVSGARRALDAYAGRLGRQAAPAIETMVKQVRALVDSAGSLEEVRDKLIDLYPDLDVKDFAAVMTQAIGTSDLLGRYVVKK